MTEIEEADKYECHTSLRIILSISAFILSIIFILCGMFLLVRFWLISNFYYLFYMISTIFIGIMFTIFSCNLFLFTDVMTNKTLWPYIWFTPVTISWNVAGILLPLKEDGYYKKYSHIPVLTYSQAFYDSDAFNEKSASNHPFGRAYEYSSVFFNNQNAVIASLCCLLTIQVVFWLTSIYAYVPIFKDYFQHKSKNVKEL